MGSKDDVQYFRSDSNELISCRNTFMRFLLANVEYLLLRMQSAMTSEAIAAVLTEDLPYACKSYAEKTLDVRPIYEALPSYRRRTTGPGTSIESLSGELSDKDIELLNSLFLGLTVKDFTEIYDLDGKYFQFMTNPNRIPDRLITLPINSTVLNKWYPNSATFIKQEPETENILAFWLAYAMALHDCIHSRESYQSLLEFLGGDKR